MEQERQRETGQDEDKDMEYGGPGKFEKGAEEENLHDIAFTVAQEDGEDVVETYEARDGKKPPIERELDDINEGQSNVIECEELPVVPGGDEGANEKIAEGDSTTHAAEKGLINNAEEKTSQSMESPKFQE